MPDIQLNFINQSAQAKHPTIVIFQKNQASTFDEIAVAWTVINNCGFNCYHPFAYPMGMQVSASDSWGNYTQKLSATNGQLFTMSNGLTGDILAPTGPAAGAVEVEVLNGLATGSITANIFKNGKLLSRKKNIVPGQKAVFEFKPAIYIGLANNIVEGDEMNSAVVTNINTEFSLLGIAGADIVMTGGGVGSTSTPLVFSLQNVTYL